MNIRKKQSYTINIQNEFVHKHVKHNYRHELSDR